MNLSARPLASIWFTFLPVLALANGAMGLGLEQWSLTYWFVYVAVTVAFEAVYIGRRIGLTTGKSAGASIVGNFITGVLCAGGGLCAPFFHMSFVGSVVNPDPLLNAVALLAIFALPSALIEAFVWRLFARETHVALAEGRIVGSSFLAHLIGIPLALVILLMPSRPYEGLERVSGFYRRIRLQIALSQIFSPMEKLPDLSRESLESLLAKTYPEEDYWATLYEPEFHRFDTSEARRRPMLINQALSGKELHSGAQDFRWLVRAPPDSRFPMELQVDLDSGSVRLNRTRQ